MSNKNNAQEIATSTPLAGRDLLVASMGNPSLTALAQSVAVDVSKILADTGIDRDGFVATVQNNVALILAEHAVAKQQELKLDIEFGDEQLSLFDETHHRKVVRQFGDVMTRFVSRDQRERYQEQQQ